MKNTNRSYRRVTGHRKVRRGNQIARRKRILRRKRIRNRLKGFALVALLVVLVVMAVGMLKAEETYCMSDGCKNHRPEDKVYCELHQTEYEDYKTKAHDYQVESTYYETMKMSWEPGSVVNLEGCEK